MDLGLWFLIRGIVVGARTSDLRPDLIVLELVVREAEMLEVEMNKIKATDM